MKDQFLDFSELLDVVYSILVKFNVGVDTVDIRVKDQDMRRSKGEVMVGVLVCQV